MSTTRKDMARAITFNLEAPLLESSTPSAELSVDSIYPSQLQYRKYYDQEEVESLGRSLLEKQLQPILVRPRPNEPDKFEIVFGQKRWMSCHAVGKTTIAATVEDLSDEQVIAIALTENMQRSNPNPLEETQGLLTLLTLKTGLNQKAIIKLLNDYTRSSDFVDNDVHKNEWAIILEVLGTYNLTPASFRKHRIPLLSLPDDVRSALERGKIEYTKALAIAKVKDDDERMELLEAAEDGLTLKEINQRIKPAPAVPDVIVFRVKSLVPKLKVFSSNGDAKKAGEIAALLDQLEELLS